MPDRWHIVHDSPEHGIWLDGPVRQEVDPWSRHGSTYPVCDRMTFTRPRGFPMMRAEDIVEMAKDAARYRYLREEYHALFSGDTPEDMDATVDAEMKEEQQ